MSTCHARWLGKLVQSKNIRKKRKKKKTIKTDKKKNKYILKTLDSPHAYHDYPVAFVFLLFGVLFFLNFFFSPSFFFFLDAGEEEASGSLLDYADSPSTRPTFHPGAAIFDARNQ